MVSDAAAGSNRRDDRANVKYEVVVSSAPILERGVRALGTLAIGLVTQGDVGLIPGGQRVRVKVRPNGVTVAKFKQRFGDDDDWEARLNGELKSLSVDEFERKWIPVS